MEERRSHASYSLPDPRVPAAHARRGDEIQAARGDHHHHRVSSWLIVHRLLKLPRTLLLALFVSLSLLLVATGHPTTRPTVLRAIHLHRAGPGRPPPTRFLPATLVGPRRFPNLYRRAHCSADDFIQSIGRAQIAPNGASRAEPNASDATSVALPPFQFSFELPSCPPPHIFTSEEACDLISSFGGVFMRGDSFVRHVHNALLMLLRGRTDGAMIEQGFNSRCRGDGMFDDRTECRAYLLEDTQDSNEPLCEGSVYAFYLRAELVDEHDLSPFYQWQDWLPAAKRMHSPIFYQSSGIHYAYSMATSVNFIQPVIDLAARSYPGVLSLWGGLHAPGSNLGVDFVESQGREVVLTYNEKVQRLINFRSPGQLHHGAMKVLPWFNITSGAFSYDGTHYGYQVNQEKVQLLLNLLDISWGEIERRGGVVALQPG